MPPVGIHSALVLRRICSVRDMTPLAIMRAGGWKSVNILGQYLEIAEHNGCARLSIMPNCQHYQGFAGRYGPLLFGRRLRPSGLFREM